MNMDFEIDNLDGSVVGYAEAAIGRWEKRWEKELFSFTGFSTTIPLIDVEANYSVEVWEGDLQRGRLHRVVGARSC